MPVSTATSVSPRSRVSRVVRTGDGAIVQVVGDSGVARGIEFRLVPKSEIARRWASHVRRVDSVVIDVDRGVATATGRGRRLPFRRQIPLSVAMALAEQGTPTEVQEEMER